MTDMALQKMGTKRFTTGTNIKNLSRHLNAKVKVYVGDHLKNKIEINKTLNDRIRGYGYEPKFFSQPPVKVKFNGMLLWMVEASLDEIEKSTE